MYGVRDRCDADEAPGDIRRASQASAAGASVARLRPRFPLRLRHVLAGARAGPAASERAPQRDRDDHRGAALGRPEAVAGEAHAAARDAEATRDVTARLSVAASPTQRRARRTRRVVAARTVRPARGARSVARAS